MKEWEKDRIWNWLIAAANNNSGNDARYYIDIRNNNLISLEIVDGILTPGDSQNSKYHQSSQKYRDYINDCMNKLRNDDNGIIEFPPINENFPMLEDPNAQIFSKRKEDIEKMNRSYRCMVYAEKTLQKLGIEFQNLKIK
ncbi:MAG: hypothetical protein Mars2KO_19430 [Maribacter sp.]